MNFRPHPGLSAGFLLLLSITASAEGEAGQGLAAAGDAAAADGRSDIARRLWSQALEQLPAPQKPALSRRLARLELDAAAPAAALKWLSQAGGDESASLLLRGEALQALGRDDEAELLLLRRWPEDLQQRAEALRLRGLIRLGRIADASALAQAPGSHVAPADRFRLACLKGDAAAAKTQLATLTNGPGKTLLSLRLELLAETAPPLPLLRSITALKAVDLRLEPGAASLLQEASRRISPSDPGLAADLLAAAVRAGGDAKLQLQEACLRDGAGQKDEALAILRRSLEKGNDPSLRFGLAVLLRRHGDKTGSRQQLDLLLATPNSEWRGRALIERARIANDPAAAASDLEAAAALAQEGEAQLLFRLAALRQAEAARVSSPTQPGLRRAAELATRGGDEGLLLAATLLGEGGLAKEGAALLHNSHGLEARIIAGRLLLQGGAQQQGGAELLAAARLAVDTQRSAGLLLEAAVAAAPGAADELKARAASGDAAARDILPWLEHALAVGAWKSGKGDGSLWNRLRNDTAASPALRCDAWAWCARDLRKMKRFPEALDAYVQALALASKTRRGGLLLEQAGLLIENGDEETALSRLEQDLGQASSEEAGRAALLAASLLARQTAFAEAAAKLDAAALLFQDPQLQQQAQLQAAAARLAEIRSNPGNAGQADPRLALAQESLKKIRDNKSSVEIHARASLLWAESLLCGLPAADDNATQPALDAFRQFFFDQLEARSHQLPHHPESLARAGLELARLQLRLGRHGAAADTYRDLAGTGIPGTANCRAMAKACNPELP